ncbi:flavin reductase family protein [Actinoplanes sp. NPDC051346]|uniref:flavin reductase family protein n=1 Tax=Actinoplanes sp. NPDC051346 TaxID=3155048 RepID=UPI0034362D81
MNVDLRATMRTFATGVTVVTTYVDRPEGRRHDAVTVNSLSSVSLEPPLVAIGLRHASPFLADVLESRVFAVSILDVGAADLAGAFAARRDQRAAALSSLSATPGAATGALVIDSPGWLECVYHQQVAFGDHTLVVGEVVAAGVQERRPPLIFLHGSYHALAQRAVPLLPEAIC